MSIPVATRNEGVAAVVVNNLSLHAMWPGVIGANELIGGSPVYTRKNVTFGSTSGGQKTLASPVTFDVPASTVRWIGMWSGATFVGAAPNGGDVGKNFVAMPSSNALASTAHGYANADPVAFFNGQAPGGLSEGVVYFVVNATADTFQVAATLAGAPIHLTTGSSFGCVCARVTEKVYAAQDTHQVAAFTIAWPD